MSNLEDHLRENINRIFASNLPKKIAVAVSGGVDSLALLLLLKNILKQEIEIFCLNIDHNIRPNSAKESQFVANFCQKYSINCHILKSSFTSPPSSDIENSLRKMRYDLLQKFCCENDIAYLFCAHHLQDVAENFLIRLFRGSGIDGLAAMEEISNWQNITIIRPLLDFTKDDLKQYLQEHQEVWIEDESNEDEKFLRNKIRKFLNDLPDSKAINSRISNAAREILDAKKIIQKQTEIDFPKIFKFNNLGYFTFDIAAFKALPEKEATRYLALALMKISGNYYKPRLEKLLKIYEVICAGNLKKAQTFYGCVLEALNQQQILIYREKAAIKDVKIQENLIFDNRFELKFNKDEIDENVVISTLNATQFNFLVKNSKSWQKFKNIKNPIKKIFLTIPVLKKDGEILKNTQLLIKT